nr:hypothetical protein [Tanacetum cinerariifolium]
SLNYSRVSSTNLTAGSQGVTPSNASSHDDDSDSDDEPYVLIIQSTPTPVVPIVDEATTQNDADRLGLAFPSLNPMLGVGTASIGFSISAGRPTGFAGRPVSTGRPSGSIARTPVPADIHDGLKIFDCPKSGIFTSSSYDEEFASPDANNLERSLDVSSTITKRIHNIHPTSQVLGDINSPVQTRRQVKHKGSSESAFISYIHDQRRNNHTDFQLCMFSCFLSQEEPTTVAQALADPDWNKRDSRGIVCRNKARLVAQGHRQEEEIDYTDVFAPVARIEAIRLFLVFASFMGFMVYQMDVKSAFLYRKIAEEVYVTQPRGFEDPDHPKKVYKVVKALYGLHQAPRAWHQVTPKTSNLLSVKRIFKYLTAYPKLGLCVKSKQYLLPPLVKLNMWLLHHAVV